MFVASNCRNYLSFPAFLAKKKNKLSRHLLVKRLSTIIRAGDVVDCSVAIIIIANELVGKPKRSGIHLWCRPIPGLKTPDRQSAIYKFRDLESLRI